LLVTGRICLETGVKLRIAGQISPETAEPNSEHLTSSRWRGSGVLGNWLGQTDSQIGETSVGEAQVDHEGYSRL